MVIKQLSMKRKKLQFNQPLCCGEEEETLPFMCLNLYINRGVLLALFSSYGLPVLLINVDILFEKRKVNTVTKTCTSQSSFPEKKIYTSKIQLLN